VFAEVLVATALGITGLPRVSWTGYDLECGRAKIIAGDDHLSRRPRYRPEWESAGLRSAPRPRFDALRLPVEAKNPSASFSLGAGNDVVTFALTADGTARFTADVTQGATEEYSYPGATCWERYPCRIASSDKGMASREW
jgi:hypothetical protein